MTKTRVILVTGVAGAGKTTVGRALAERLGCTCIEGDDHHGEHSVAKMARGEPLTDADRAPWLDGLRREIEHHLDRGSCAVVAASALRATYRARLHAADPRVLVVLLSVPYDVSARRLAARRDHFFSGDLLDSQFATLEPPDDALAIPAELAVDKIVDRIVARAGAADPSSGAGPTRGG